MNRVLKKMCLRVAVNQLYHPLSCYEKTEELFPATRGCETAPIFHIFLVSGGMIFFFFFFFHIWKVCSVPFMLLSRVVKQRLMRITLGLGDWRRSWWRRMSVTLTFLWKTTNLAPDIEPKADRLWLFWCAASGTTSRILFKKPQYHSEHLTLFLKERLKMLLGSHS